MHFFVSVCVYMCANSVSLNSVHIAWAVINPATAPPVLVPVVTMAERTSADGARVVFEPQSLGIFDIRYYVADDPSTPNLVCTTCMYSEYLCIISPTVQSNKLCVTLCIYSCVITSIVTVIIM